jgi:sodium/bile acid cotransporter 7
VLGLLSRALVPDVLTPDLWAGVMFLCCLPSTVQSSIAFTTIAKGNVAAAMCSASFSNLIGIVLTPALVTVFLVTQTGGGVSLVAVRDIVLQLSVPFVAGQLLRKWIGGFIARHKQVLGYVDRGSILLVVYAAFSEGVVAGIWGRLTIPSLLLLFLANAAILGTVIGSTMWIPPDATDGMRLARSTLCRSFQCSCSPIGLIDEFATPGARVATEPHSHR